jgi:hypothetical protein
MIAIIQCAASKRPDAGYLRRQDGTRVKFVADPTRAPADSGFVYAHPDDNSDVGANWRQVLVQYNANHGNNALGLLQAFELYENLSYRRAAEHFGVAKTYILSAGWGLIRASFLTPNYDITLSAQAKKKAPWKFRSKGDHYEDFCQLTVNSTDSIVYFGGKDYIRLLCTLTDGVNSKRTLFYNSDKAPEAPGWRLQRFLTPTRTNWHYECLNAFLDGKITAQT